MLPVGKDALRARAKALLEEIPVEVVSEAQNTALDESIIEIIEKHLKQAILAGAAAHKNQAAWPASPRRRLR